jgi:hypothetical protein
MTSTSLDAVSEALGSIREALEADGYALTVGGSQELVELQVSATPEACEECLVPKHLFELMAVSALAEHDLNLTADNLKVLYPVDLH